MQELTYDIIFCDEDKSEAMGLDTSFEFCKEYIERNNGKEIGFFKHYKGGGCLIVLSQNPLEVVFETDVI